MTQSKQDVPGPTMEEWFENLENPRDVELRICDKCGIATREFPGDKWKQKHFSGQCQLANRLHTQTVATIAQIEATMVGGARITPSLLSTYRQLIRREFEQAAEPTPVIADSPPKPFMRAGAYKNTWPGKVDPDSGTELSLSLLVVDFGKKCVIHNEGPERQINIGPCHFSFAELKRDLDEQFGAKPPVPRLERAGTGWHIRHDEGIHNLPWISDDDYAALCQLAGVEIPIWEAKAAGTWTQLVGGIGEHTANDVLNISIWRFEVKGT